MTTHSGKKLLLLSAVLAACDQELTAPSAELGPDLAIPVHAAEPLQLTTVDGRTSLQWLEPVQQDQVSRDWINKRGGTLSVAPGIDLVVPKNALVDRTEIQMTSRAGEDVAVEFGPHGLQFESPVKVRIRVEALANGAEILNAAGVAEGPTWSGALLPSKVLLGSIDAVYYAEEEGEVVTVIESFPVYLEYGVYLTFETDHFSGYALAS
ncbi:MAG: hypothetical protein OEO23_03955 [Gemmatimonadota bacterium]|nr:hypothetical protein [Gemmatimonadota bacterium]